MGGIMEHSVEMGSCGIIVHKDGSGIQKSIGGLTDRQQGDLISLPLFFKIRKIGKKLRR
jgi:hypothetical protein